jgi:predicted dehydrogenase
LVSLAECITAIADREAVRLQYRDYDIFYPASLSPPPMINAAVIGLGRWGKSIVEAVQGKSKRLHVIRGVSKEPDLVRDFAATHGFELSTDFEEAVADRQVQAVFLATPHSLHVGQISAVAAAGKPVWCEKPLALTRRDAERAIAACAKAGVVFGLGNN